MLAGAALVLLGECLIVIRVRPFSDFYFPFAWLGFIFLLEGAVDRVRGSSLLSRAPRSWSLLFCVSIAVWWLFEWFDQAVHNWNYIGGEMNTGLGFVLNASLDFSTVVPAVWAASAFLYALAPAGDLPFRRSVPVPIAVLAMMLAAAVVCTLLPILWPRYFFGLIWGSTFFLLDPINYRLGRPSLIEAVWNRHWRLPLCFAFGALMCGFFWEAWNYWSLPKWSYAIPFVDFWHIFEMPLLGWLGYLPFGLEIFAMTNFALALLRLPGLTLEAKKPSSTAFEQRARAV